MGRLFLAGQQSTLKMWASLILAACVAHTVTSQCAPGFSFYQNSCYYVVATRLTWFGADKYCTTILPKNLNVRLVTVSNIGEDNFVRDLIRRDNDAKNRDNWMGLTDIDKRRGWVWAATQSSLGYSNWREGRPSSSGRCAFYSYYYNGQWYNDDCYDQRSFVCEYSLFGEKEIEEQKANELELKKNCPSGFVSFGNSCYYVIPSSLTWFQAEHYCSLMVPRTYDCHLASFGPVVITWTPGRDGTGLLTRDPSLILTGPAVNRMDLVNVSSCGKVETTSGTMPPVMIYPAAMDSSAKLRDK